MHFVRFPEEMSYQRPVRVYGAFHSLVPSLCDGLWL